MLPRSLLDGLESRETIARLLDLGDRAVQVWETQVSDFLSPPEQMEAAAVFAKLTDVHIATWGGYPQAERQRLAIARADLPLTTDDIPIAAIDIAGNFLFDPASHRDFLGAMLGTGIERDRVGDILVLGERGAQALVVPDLVEFLSFSLVQVRTVPVKVRAIPLAELRVPAPRVKELATVEASLRLDAVASAGFGLSRSKMVDLIAGDEVRVNWKSVTQPSYQLKAGDLVTVRGKGRLHIGEITVTKKERYRIQLTRFI